MHILWDEWAEKYKWELVAALAALIVIAAGIFWWRSSQAEPDSVQVLSAQSEKSATVSAEAETLAVDIAGEVFRPGVYRLKSGDRVDDVLKLSGGITDEADREWVAANINKDEKVRDGMKLFIPAKSQFVADSESNAVNNLTPTSAVININAATVEELNTLKGVGSVTANKIITNRPYGSIDELWTKKIVSKSVFANIKDQIQAW